MTLWHFDFEPLLKEKTKLITHAEVPVSLIVFLNVKTLSEKKNKITIRL